MNASSLPTLLMKPQTKAEYPARVTVGRAIPLLTNLAQAVWTYPRWSWVSYVLLAWEIRRLVWVIWWKSPRNVRIVGYPTVLGKYATAIRMMWDTDAIVQDAYDTCKGNPFAIPMIDRYLVMVPDREQARQLEHHTPLNLSEIEALHELASTNLVLGDVKVSSDRYFKDGTGALRKHLRSKIPEMSADMRARVRQTFTEEFRNADPWQETSTTDGRKENGPWKRIYLVPALMRMITRVNLPMFVGNELGEDPKVFESLMTFFWNCLSTLLVIAFTPAFLVPLVGRLFMGWGIARWKLYNTILGLAYVTMGGQKAENGQKPLHLVQWVADMIKVSDAVEIAKTSIGLVFGSAFQIPMITQAVLYHLSLYPDYQPKLRQEAYEHEVNPVDGANTDLPRMDSFMKETARLSPGLVLSVPRRVMSTYVSSDGVIVPEGNWVAIPQYTLMRDPKIWPGGKKFIGERFLDAEGRSRSRFTHPSHEFPYWGSIGHACPARFYAAALVKIILAHLLCNYEFRLEKPEGKLFFCFGMIRLTNPLMTLLVRERIDGMTIEARKDS